MSFAKPNIPKIGDEQIDRALGALASAMTPALTSQIVDGVLVSKALIVGTNVVDHKLGRRILGWIPVRVRGAVNIYDSNDSNSTPERTLVLVSDAAVTVDLWVF